MTIVCVRGDPCIMSHLHWADTVAATLGASSLVLVTQPLDTTKVNMQIQRNVVTAPGKEVSAAAPRGYLMRESLLTARRLVAQRGVAALWSGTAPALYAYGMEHAVLFTVYEAVLRAVELDLYPGTGLHQLAPIKALCCAASCSVSSLFLAPADAVKCKMQAAPHDAKHRNSLDCLRAILRNEGAWSLFRNYRSVLARDSIFFGTYMFVRELSLSVMDRVKYQGHNMDDANRVASNGGDHRTFTELFFAGGFAGSAAWCVATPMDVVNSRRQTDVKLAASQDVKKILQRSVHGPSLLGEVVRTLRAEGVAALFRGTGLNVLRGFIGYGIFTTVYINVLGLLGSSSHAPTST